MFGGLYDNPLPSKRGDPIFNIHSYPTKIDPVAVLTCILAHTEPGETVFDGFSGSGTTAIASFNLNRNCITTDVNPDAIKIADVALKELAQEKLNPLVEVLY